MPWLREYNEDDHHVCRLPDIKSKGVGSEWMCETCKKVYQIRQKFFGERRRWAYIGRFADGTYLGQVRDPEAHGLRPPRAPSGTSAGRASSSDANPKKSVRHLIVIPPDKDSLPRTSCCAKLPAEIDREMGSLTTIPSHCTCKEYKP